MLIALVSAAFAQMLEPPRRRYFCLPAPGLELRQSMAMDDVADAILDNVASGILATRARIQLWGFADDDVPRDEGLLIARQRASLIRDELVKRGVSVTLLFHCDIGRANRPSPLCRHH